VKAVTIIDGKMAIIEVAPGKTYDAIKEVVGGWIERFASLPVSRYRHVDMWCNEEFLLNGMLPNVAIIYPYANVIRGGIIILAGDERTGESEGLTDEEISQIKLVRFPGEPIPTLFYQGFEQAAPPMQIPDGWFVIDATIPPDPAEFQEKLRELTERAKNQEKDDK
jgi:hypothetical protein